MQSVLSRNWTRIAVSISCDNNHYTTGTTESLLIAAQNNAIRSNQIKMRIDKMQQNSKCRLRGDRDETIHHIISECSKLAQKEYKTRHDWVGKVIHWEMCKKFNFDHTNKWYMHNPTAVLENDTQTPVGLWHTNGSPNFGQKIRPYSNQQKFGNLQNCRLCCTSWAQNKTVRKWEKDKYLDLARELEKLWNMKVTIIPIGTIIKGLLKEVEDLEVGGRMETIQTTALLRMIRILRRVLETWGDLLFLKIQSKTIS